MEMLPKVTEMAGVWWDEIASGFMEYDNIHHHTNSHSPRRRHHNSKKKTLFKISNYSTFDPLDRGRWSRTLIDLHETLFQPSI